MPYYLICNMCNEKETFIGMKVGDFDVRFKSRMKQHISGCGDGDSTCKFLRHVFKCDSKNGNLNE